MTTIEQLEQMKHEAASLEEAEDTIRGIRQELEKRIRFEVESTLAKTLFKDDEIEPVNDASECSIEEDEEEQ